MRISLCPSPPCSSPARRDGCPGRCAGTGGSGHKGRSLGGAMQLRAWARRRARVPLPTWGGPTIRSAWGRRPLASQVSIACMGPSWPIRSHLPITAKPRTAEVVIGLAATHQPCLAVPHHHHRRPKGGVVVAGHGQGVGPGEEEHCGERDVIKRLEHVN